MHRTWILLRLLLLPLAALFFSGCSIFSFYAVPDDQRSLLAVLNAFTAGSGGGGSVNSSTACWDYSQLFTDSGNTLPALTNGAGAFGDVDGDGDEDLAVTGNDGARSAAIYANDGSGNFSVTGASLTGVDQSSVVFGDVDGDGDLDLIIQGNDGGGQSTLRYLNDGGGNFTSATAGLTALELGGLALADIEGDGDLDLIQQGYTGAAVEQFVYANDGSGNFTDTGSGATKLAFGYLATGDLNGDGAIDFVGGGYDPGFTTYSLVYTNNGSGVFTDAATGLAADEFDHALGDVDGDGDLDLVQYGGVGNAKGGIYFNDGSGNFSADGRHSTDAFSNSAAVFGDIDGDGDQDLVLGGNNDITDLTRLYINPGDGSFMKVATGLIAVNNGDLQLADVDGDGDLDLLVLGPSGTQIYTNGSETNPVYSGFDCSAFDPLTLFSQVSAGLTGVRQGGLATADVDGDGDLDVLLTGQDSGSTLHTKLYRNDGNLAFTDTGASLTALRNAQAAFADVNGDGDQDLVIAGLSSGPRVTTLYTNDGAGNFTDAGAGLTGVQDAIVTFADVNGDGDQDLLVSGYNGSAYIATLYTNDGSGGFTDSGESLVGAALGAHAFADVDGDGDLDLLITGTTTGSVSISTLYTNNGSGNFTDAGAGLTDLRTSSASFADADGDGDLDLFMTGRDGSSQERSLLYLNDGAGNFNASGATFTGLYVGSGSGFVDIDNDGDQDLLLVGRVSNEGRSLLYVNDGAGNFTRLDVTILGLHEGDLHFADLDGDGDMDVINSGYTSGDVARTAVYRNDL